jgi:hypothetical protein
MPIPFQVASEILNTFLGEQISENGINSVGTEFDSYSDLLAKILIDTDFLQYNPVVKKALQERMPAVTRCILDSPKEALLHTIAAQKNELSLQLFDKQREYTVRTGELVALEREILALRKIIIEC